MAFAEAKRRLIECLENDEYEIESSRRNLEAKNLLAAGEITRDELVAILEKCRGFNYKCEPHHTEPVDIHVFRVHGWYIKSYFFEGGAMLVSVHQSGDAS